MIFNAYICDIDNQNVGAWLYFPTTDTTFYNTLLTAGIKDLEFKVSMYETEIEGLKEHLTEYEDIEALNRLALEIGALSQFEQEKYHALLQANSIRGIDDLIRYTQSAKDYDLFPIIQTAEDLAHYHIDELDTYKISPQTKETIKKYIQYTALGEKIRSDENGFFTKYGYIKPIQKTESEG